MPSQVTPTETGVHRDHEMPSKVSVQPTMNEVSVVEDSIPHQGNVNEKLLKAIDEVYSPVLKLMKLFGTYFGDTSLKRLARTDSRCRKYIYLSHIYCGLVISGFWLNFVMGFFDIFYGNNVFLFLMFSLWCLLIALNCTICLVVLCVPFGDTRHSRFENFLRNLLAINSNVSLEKVKRKSRKGIIMFCFLFLTAVAGIMSTYLLLDLSVAAFKPWNQWFGLTIVSQVFLIIGCGAWFLPILFFYITCLILEALFDDDLHKRMSSSHSIPLDLAALKMEHHKLCEVVEFADKMLAPLIFEMVSLYLPLICLNFYKAVNLPEEGRIVFLVTNLVWLVVAGSILAIIMIFGSKVYEKIHSLQKILQTLPFSKEDEGKVLMFILDI
ncbi:hypothetical protein OS493_019243 [Desmophyllum pertusum]|uniref:Gustatory receptor n=1 Tax=Desmophyllum pertusum TaxID=174260 RepID=A0A9W9YDB7_9CNID|nr:hypothetical protein OS493_019243 [Desmophyllum pertusum]